MRGESPWNDAIERALTADPLPGNLRDLQRLAWLLMAHGTALAGGAALREWVEMQARLREAEPGDGDGKLPDALSRGTWKERLKAFAQLVAQEGRRGHGSYTAAAKELQVDERTLREHAKGPRRLPP